MSILAFCREELRHIFRRQPRLAAFLLGVPLVYTLLFGLVYSNNVVRFVPTVIYDQDHTANSHALVQAFADSEKYDIVAYSSSEEEKNAALREQTALVAITIPPNFARDIKQAKATQVLVEVNGSNLMFANSAIGSAQEIVQTFAGAAGTKLLESLNQMPDQALRTVAPIRFGLRVLNNPTYGYGNFILAGIGANGLQLAILLAICGIFVRDRNEWARYAGTPTWKMLLGRLLPYWLLGWLMYVVYLLLISQLFLLPCRGAWSEILLLGGLFTLTVCGVGAFYSALSPSEVYAVQLPMLYTMPAFLFSGYSWPQLAMNDFSRFFSALLPLSYSADPLRDLMLAGYAPTLWRNLGGLSLLCLFFWSATAALLHWRRQRISREVKL